MQRYLQKWVLELPVPGAELPSLKKAALSRLEAQVFECVAHGDGRRKVWASGLVRYLCREACASIHNKGPELMAAGHRGDAQAVLLGFLEELLQVPVGHMLLDALIHGFMRGRIVDNDPLSSNMAKDMEVPFCLGVASIIAAGRTPPAQPNALYPKHDRS